jgi:hypothetical protein
MHSWYNGTPLIRSSRGWGADSPVPKLSGNADQKGACGDSGSCLSTMVQMTAKVSGSSPGQGNKKDGVSLLVSAHWQRRTDKILTGSTPQGVAMKHVEGS